VFKRLTFAALVSMLSVTAVVGVALATSQAGVTSTPIGSGTLDELNINVKTDPWMLHLRTKGQSTVAVVENRVIPGGTFGWHSHPGPSLIVVKSGAITFYHDDDPTCTGETYTADYLVLAAGSGCSSDDHCR
jgi:quercetin dioxygenase-like cupin family protein